MTQKEHLAVSLLGLGVIAWAILLLTGCANTLTGDQLKWQSQITQRVNEQSGQLEDMAARLNVLEKEAVRGGSHPAP